MAGGVDAAKDWQTAYFQLLGTPAASKEEAERLGNKLQYHLSALPGTLKLVAAEAEAFGIDSSPVWEVAGNVQQLHNNTEEFDQKMNQVWNITRRIESLESVAPPAPPGDGFKFEVHLRGDNSNGTAGDFHNVLLHLEHAAEQVEYWRDRAGYNGIRPIRLQHEATEPNEMLKRWQLLLEKLRDNLKTWPSARPLATIAEAEGKELSAVWFKQWKAKRAIDLELFDTVDDVMLSVLLDAPKVNRKEGLSIADYYEKLVWIARKALPAATDNSRWFTARFSPEEQNRRCGQLVELKRAASRGWVQDIELQLKWIENNASQFKPMILRARPGIDQVQDVLPSFEPMIASALLPFVLIRAKDWHSEFAGWCDTWDIGAELLTDEFVEKLRSEIDEYDAKYPVSYDGVMRLIDALERECGILLQHADRADASRRMTSIREFEEQETSDGETTPADDSKLPKKLKKLSPSRVRAKSAYDWAMSNIPNAEHMGIDELHEAIQLHGDDAIVELIPDRAATFGRYLRDAGVKRYTKGSLPIETRSVRSVRSQ